MSSAAVRNAIEAELQAWCTANGVEFVDTINAAGSPTGANWAAVEFAKESDTPVDFSGTRSIEEGSGDASGGNLADSAVAYFSALAPLANNVEILSVDSPTSDGAPEGRSYGITVTLNYQRYPS